MIELKLPGEIISFDKKTDEGKIQGSDGKCYRFHSSSVDVGRADILVGRKVVFVPLMTGRGLRARGIEMKY